MSKNTNELKTRTPPMSSSVRSDAVRRLMETKSERGRSGLAYSVTCLTALRRGHAAPPIVGKWMMEEVARCQPNGLAAFHNGTDDVGCQEGITDCLAHPGVGMAFSVAISS